MARKGKRGRISGIRGGWCGFVSQKVVLQCIRGYEISNRFECRMSIFSEDVKRIYFLCLEASRFFMRLVFRHSLLDFRSVFEIVSSVFQYRQEAKKVQS